MCEFVRCVSKLGSRLHARAFRVCVLLCVCLCREWVRRVCACARLCDRCLCVSCFYVRRVCVCVLSLCVRGECISYTGVCG